MQNWVVSGHGMRGLVVHGGRRSAVEPALSEYICNRQLCAVLSSLFALNGARAEQRSELSSQPCLP